MAIVNHPLEPQARLLKRLGRVVLKTVDQLAQMLLDRVADAKSHVFVGVLLVTWVEERAQAIAAQLMGASPRRPKK